MHKVTDISAYIDHTLLAPEATETDIQRLCDEAATHGFASVCVNPVWVSFATRILRDSPVQVCAVIDFPLGAATHAMKAAQAAKAIEDGADELDMVIDIGALKSDNTALVKTGIDVVRQSTPDAVLKVIIETCLLTDKEKQTACTIAQDAGSDFIKTSTGFSTGGATVEDIKLIRKTVGPKMGIKASGGIHDAQVAFEMIKAGATRIGTSHGLDMLNT